MSWIFAFIRASLFLWTAVNVIVMLILSLVLLFTFWWWWWAAAAAARRRRWRWWRFVHSIVVSVQWIAWLIISCQTIYNRIFLLTFFISWMIWGLIVFLSFFAFLVIRFRRGTWTWGSWRRWRGTWWWWRGSFVLLFLLTFFALNISVVVLIQVQLFTQFFVLSHCLLQMIVGSSLKIIFGVFGIDGADCWMKNDKIKVSKI